MEAQLQKKSNTLFAKILISFLTIILLFSTFSVVAFTFFQSNIQKEIIRYNRLILNNIADRYSTHFSRIKTLLFNYYYDESMVGFNRELLLVEDGHQANYLKAKEMIVKMRSDIYNPLFYLDNVIVYFLSDEFTIDKEGSSSSWQQFGHSYVSEQYPLQFWREQFVRSQNFNLLRSAQFLISGDATNTRELLPFSFKLPESNYLIIGLIDMDKINPAFFGRDAGRSFLILGAEGQLLYSSSGEQPSDPIPTFTVDRDYTLVNETYYFGMKDDEGLTYITVVPYASIASQLKKINATLLFIFFLAVAIGIAAAFFFSKRINTPVKQLISAIVDRRPFKPQRVINEFAFIHQKINELHVEKEDVQNELLRKKSVLTSYNYINKLKSINTEISEWKDFINTDESFTVILYDLRFRPAALTELQISSDRAAYYNREHVKLVTEERFPGAHTFQIESNQILTVIPGDMPKDLIRKLLEDLKTIFDKDKQYCLITTAVSSKFEHSIQFNYAYRQVTEMVQQAMLLEETQLLFQNRRLPGSFTLGPTQDQELNACLQAGNEAGCIQLVDRWLDEMMRKEASVVQFRQFAEAISSKTMKLTEIFKVEPALAWPMKPVIQQLKESCTLEEYKSAFHQLFALSCEAICSKKKENDPIIDFVMDVLLTKYDEDISLDYLADKRNMSSAYLSVYIKEKTGINFSEHLNQIRIEKAKEQLAHTVDNIQEIAVRIGYRNITSFNRMFKKSTGMTPGEYRRYVLDEN